MVHEHRRTLHRMGWRDVFRRLTFVFYPLPPPQKNRKLSVKDMNLGAILCQRIAPFFWKKGAFLYHRMAPFFSDSPGGGSSCFIGLLFWGYWHFHCNGRHFEFCALPLPPFGLKCKNKKGVPILTHPHVLNLTRTLS